MNKPCNPKASSNSRTEAGPSSVVLVISGLGHCPSKKNRHFPLTNGALGIDKSVRDRMKALENAILSALYSECQIVGNETHSECWKRLRTLLSGLSDDSIREIPTGSWAVEHVANGQEGMQITIQEIP